MDMLAGLIERLLADTAVTAFVGTKVFPVDRPELSNLPALTLQIVSEPRAQTMDGFQPLRQAIVQVDAWSASYGQASALKEAVIACLVPAATVGNVVFRRAFVTQRDLGEQTDSLFVHRPSMDFTVNFSTS